MHYHNLSCHATYRKVKAFMKIGLPPNLSSSFLLRHFPHTHPLVILILDDSLHYKSSLCMTDDMMPNFLLLKVLLNGWEMDSQQKFDVHYYIINLLVGNNHWMLNIF